MPARGDRELAARVRDRVRFGSVTQRVRRCSCASPLGLGRYVVRQVVHVQHVAAGKDARHDRLQALVHHSAARARVKFNACGNRKLVLGNQAHRKQQCVTRNSALGPRNGRQVLVDLAHLDGLHAIAPDHTRHRGGQMQRNAKVVQAVLDVAAQSLA